MRTILGYCLLGNEHKKDVIWCDKCGCVFSHEPEDSYIGFSTGNSVNCPNCNKLLKASI